MNVLGIDTATAASAACVLRSDGEAFEVEPVPARLAERPAHAAELMPAVARCMDDAGCDWAALDAIAVGVGPGMFTGLRIGVATARALAFAAGLELRPVSSLAALAAGARDAGTAARGDGDRPEAATPVLAAIDARRGELFAALYDRHGEQLWAPAALAPEAVAERIAATGLAPLAIGDGAIRHRDVLAAAGATVPEDGARAHVVGALAVCRLAAALAPVPLGAVRPDYVRAPDARPRAA